jgi:GTPase Era involved in 16S rRNA processing
VAGFEVSTEGRRHAEGDRHRRPQFLGTRVYLGLFVKVKDRWREDARTLEEMGLGESGPNR